MARRPRAIVEALTRDLTTVDLQKLFTRDTRDAYQFFSRGIDQAALERLPWHRRLVERIHLVFLAFTLKLSPARRALYGIALFAAALGLLQSFVGFGAVRVPAGLFTIGVAPVPVWREGTFWLVLGFVLMNLLVLLEVADRLSLKNDLDIAREIQQAMLPSGVFCGGGVEACGVTRPANTVGGDFYDIIPRPDGSVIIAVGDVAGKGSPASLLMALLLAILRTLVEEQLEGAALVERLNSQIWRHVPRSRFITLFLARYDPATGTLEYVNAGHLPPLLRRCRGGYERLVDGGVALGMFEAATYVARRAHLEPGDLLVQYSDGITEAENAHGRPFEDVGLERVIEASQSADTAELGARVLAAVAAHAGDTRFADDLTILALRRLDGSEAAPETSLAAGAG